MSRAVYYYEQPSRWTRALIWVLSLAVVFLSAWILTPIAMDYLAASPTPATNQVGTAHTIPARAIDARMVEPRLGDARNADARPVAARDVDTPSTASVPAAPQDGGKAMTGRVGAAAPAVEAQPGEPPVTEPAAEPQRAAVAAVEEPASAGPAFAASGPAVFGGSSASSPAAAASTIPWPVPAAEPAPAGAPAEPEASLPPDDFGPVPLPRNRPSAGATARLGIPLPRPRPDEIAGEVPRPDDSGMNALIERTSQIE